MEALWPTRCGVCDAGLPPGATPLCPSCAAAFPRWTGRACRVCGAALPDGGARCRECRNRRRDFRFCRSFGLYAGALKRAALLFKYAGRDALARPLGECLEAVARRPELRDADLLVPVPLHFIRRHARGYNQAELLARALSDRIGVPVVDALRRRRWTRPQAGLHREARRRNVAGVFEVRRAETVPVKGRRALLIDDVCTTGATLEACARALREAGARRVDALTLARGMIRGRAKGEAGGPSTRPGERPSA